MTALYTRLRDALNLLVRELVKFGAVGAVAFVVDVGLFNLLRFGAGDQDAIASGVLADRPLTAKAISVATATVVAWLGNRYWTFRRRRRGPWRRELVLFVVMNGVGMAIALVCLATSHYLLGLQSALADNISANVVGLALGTAFRFWAYRRWVFAGLDDGLAQPVSTSGAIAGRPGRVRSAPER